MLNLLKKLVLIVVLFILNLSLLPSSEASIFLADIQGNEFEYEITRLRDKGVIKGYPNGLFYPEKPIIRSDLAIMLVSISDYKMVNPTKSSFPDVPRSHYAFQFIETAYKNNLIQPFAGLFKPNQTVTRSQLVVIACKFRGLEKAAYDITEPLMLAQDEQSVPRWAAPFFTVALRPENQLINYRVKNNFRVIEPYKIATRAEVAYTIHQILYPPKYGSTVNIALTAEPNTLNAWMDPLTLTYAVLQNIHMPTSGRDNNWALYPGLIKEIPTIENGLWILSGTGMNITFRFRDNWIFHNGKNLTIDDWAYNFSVFMDPLTPVTDRTLEDNVDLSKGKGAYGVKGFDLLEKNSVRIYYKNLNWKANLWPPGMSPYGLVVYPKELLETVYKRMKTSGNIDLFRKDENLSRKPIGLGAYKLLDWKPGVHLTMERHDSFLPGKPLIKNLIYHFIPDTTAILARLISGKGIDVTLGLAFDHARQFELTRSSHTRISYLEGLILEHIGINFRNPENPLREIAIRKAIIHAIDREKITKTLFDGLEPVAHGFFSKNHWAYNDENLIKYAHNINKSKMILEEAGWVLKPDGFRYKEGKKLTIILETTSGITFRERVQAILKAQLKEVGIDLDISKNRPAQILLSSEYRSAGKWPHAMMFGWVGDPLFIGDTVFRSDQIPSLENNWTGMNYYGWISQESTDILKNTVQELNEEGRIKQLGQVQKIITEELPIIPLYYRSAAIASKINLSGIKPIMIAGVFTTWNAYNWFWR